MSISCFLNLHCKFSDVSLFYLITDYTLNDYIDHR